MLSINRILNRNNRKKQRDTGSIVLEAALILPLFLSLLILLITFIRIAVVEIALQQAVQEATKQVASHTYPIDIMYKEFSQTEIGTKMNNGIIHAQSAREKVMKAEKFLKAYSEYLPKEVTTLVLVREALENKVMDGYNKTLISAFQPIVDHYADGQILHLENLYVTKVVLPNLRTRESVWFGLEVRYDLPLHIPFFQRTISLKSKAYERVWIGNNDYFVGPKELDTHVGDITSDGVNEQEEAPAEHEVVKNEQDDEELDEALVIDSINSPVQRGKSVRIIGRGPSNRTVTVKLYYKSGFVKEKTCTSDSSGWLHCELKIGGHANEGEYRAVLRVEELSAEGNFTVFSKDHMQSYIQQRNKK